MGKRLAFLLIVLPLALFMALQLIPVWLVQTNPPVVAEPRWDSPQTLALAKRACFDCHSNETTWPLSARIAPISWLVTRDVLGGRHKLNFSEWTAMREREQDEFGETITKGSMPPGIYLVLHPEARLTTAEKQQLIQGLAKSLR